MITEKDEERFWPKVDKTSTCWLWTGAKIKQGYGNWYAQGKYLRAHRASYEIAYGPIPKDVLVCHTCDVTSCVNPEHLFLGSAADNLDDMTQKGRRNAKLTKEQVVYAYKAVHSGRTCTEVAIELGVEYLTIHRIRSRITWKHITLKLLAACSETQTTKAQQSSTYISHC